MAVFELRVTLLGASPAVWRRIWVPEDADLSLIHIVLQMAMGWENSHLHEFVSADRKKYGVVDEAEPQPGLLDEAQYLLKELVSEPGDRCLYIYDFGDDWVHEIVLESVSEVEVESAAEQYQCLAGEGACPPEDCGGVPGYLELLENFSDLDAVQHDEAVDLLGEDFDPEAFDCSAFNKRISGMFQKYNKIQASEDEDEEIALWTELEKFLNSDKVPKSAMSIMMLDGFFAALAIYPVTILPSKWLPFVWDMSGEGHQPTFASQTEAERVMGLLLAFMNSVTSMLSDAPDEYLPLFDDIEIDSNKDRMLAAMDWAAGFVMGAMIDQEVWRRTIADEEGQDLLSPFVIMSGFADEDSGLSEERQNEIREKMTDDLNECVLDLQDFWEPWRKKYLARNDSGRTVRAQPRVGRNEPCPCGSGKKFKQCCGK